MKIKRVGVDLTKNVFQLHGVDRIAKAIQIRGLVTEYGLVAPQQLSSLRRAIPDWLEDADNGLTLLFRQLLQGLWGDLYVLDQRMAELDQQIAVIAQENPIAKRLQQLRGVWVH